MLKKDNFKSKLFTLFHKFARFTKHQKVFALYLFALIFFLVFSPLIKIAPVGGNVSRVWLLSGYFFKTMVVIFISLAILVGWNMSFRFKNIVINYFGFKENDALFNFVFLFIISTAFFSISDTVSVVQNTTSTIVVTGVYYFIELILIVGLVLTMMSVIKTAKLQGNKTKIINVVDEDALREVSHKKSLKGLFDEEDEEIEEISNIHRHPHHDAEDEKEEKDELDLEHSKITQDVTTHHEHTHH